MLIKGAQYVRAQCIAAWSIFGKKENKETLKTQHLRLQSSGERTERI